MKIRLMILLILLTGHYSSANTQFNPEDLKLIITGAVYCAPCKSLEKELTQLGMHDILEVNRENSKLQLRLTHLDIQKDKTVLEKLGIYNQTTPTFFAFWKNTFIFESSIPGASAESTLALAKEAVERVFLSLNSHQDTLDAFTKRLHSVAPILPSRVVMIGTGQNYETSPLFIGHTLNFAESVLARDFEFPQNQIIRLFGSGYLNSAPDFLKRDKDSQKPEPTKLSFIHSDSTFTQESLKTALKQDQIQGIARELVVISGHGSKRGIEQWNSKVMITPREFKKIISLSPAKKILINGACHGGVLALTTDCGFFGARPDTLASGCWESEDAKVKDYVSEFFKAISAAKASEQDITFEQAHWMALQTGAPEDTPYTSLDGLADNFFLKFPTALQNSILVSTLLEMTKTPGEQEILSKLLKSLDSLSRVYLKVQDITISVPNRETGLSTRLKTKMRLDGEPFSFPAFVIDNNQASLDGILDKMTFKLLPSAVKIIERKGYTLRKYSRESELFLEVSHVGKTNFGGFNINTGLGQSQFIIERTPESNPLLVQMTRRIIFRNKMNNGINEIYKKRMKSIEACEQTPISRFLSGD